MSVLLNKVSALLQKGHFYVKVPGQEMYDFDKVIPDFFIQQKYGKGWLCIDSNGSFVEGPAKELPDGTVSFVLIVDTREYERGGERVRICTEPLLCVVTSATSGMLVVSSVSEIVQYTFP